MIQALFKEPALLRSDEDRQITYEIPKDFKAAKTTYFLPVAHAEIADAGRVFPLLFLKAGEEFLMIAMMGLKEGQNLFVNNLGRWKERTYMPLLLRAYPFAVTRLENNANAIVYDKAYKGFNTQEGTRIFNDKGELSELGSGINEFIGKTFSAFEATKAPLKIIADMGLMKPLQIDIAVGEEKVRIQGVYQVDMPKLDTLSDQQLLTLAKNGALHMIYTHSNSLTNIQVLADML